MITDSVTRYNDISRLAADERDRLEAKLMPILRAYLAATDMPGHVNNFIDAYVVGAHIEILCSYTHGDTEERTFALPIQVADGSTMDPDEIRAIVSADLSARDWKQLLSPS